jgi:hypothetical protein
MIKKDEFYEPEIESLVDSIVTDAGKDATSVAFRGATFFDIQQHYHQSEEWECAMRFLDDKGMPRHEKETEAEYSLVGRITLYKAAGE